MYTHKKIIQSKDLKHIPKQWCSNQDHNIARALNPSSLLNWENLF